MRLLIAMGLYMLQERFWPCRSIRRALSSPDASS